MSEFPYVYLKELCTVNQGLQIPISKRFKESGENRYFYITVQFLKKSHTEKYYVENPPPSSICYEDDIIVVRTGSTGQILTGINGCFHNNFFKVNYHSEKVLGKYLYYCLTSKEKQNEMKRRSGITTIPDLNHFMFLDMKIPLPKYGEQKNIVKLLDSINSKIALNNQINAELEAMAKLLYDYWFVQFDFPDEHGKPYKSSGGKMVYSEVLRREVPVGWEDGLLDDLGSIIGGSTPSRKEPDNFSDNGIPWITPKDLSLNSSKKFITKGELDVSDKGLNSASLKILPKGTVLLSSRAPIGYMAIARENLTTNQGFKSFVPKKGFSTPFIYYAVKSTMKVIEQNASGSTFKEISGGVLKCISICLPEREIIEKFTKKVDSIFKRQDLLELENQQLAELRDWLLPMLMNGQVKVGE
ncbi:MAG: restriction endonuclease subunit S [Lewinellaceae bacterium]|nr:restriction endonuclease subunit S [Lewinellaceae bacterium]